MRSIAILGNLCSSRSWPEDVKRTMFDFERGKIRLIRGGKYPTCHSVFIDDDIRAVIDPASDEAKLLAIHRERPIQVIINSHCHEDHFLFNSRFPDAALWVPSLEAAGFRGIDAFFDQFYESGDIDDKTRAAWDTFFTDFVQYQPREPDRLLKDGEILVFGKTRGRVLHTPGHSPGHLSFHFPEEGVLYLADQDLVKFGPYYGDKGSSIDDTIASLQRVAAIDVDVYLVAHGREGVIEGDPAHIQRYLDVIYTREERLLTLLASGPKNLDEITAEGIIYGGRSLAAGAWELTLSEKIMMDKHLQRLEGLRTVRQEDGYYHLA
ncbi:MAG: MBL fold metallo-hydrolase [Gemmatimonadales bacterium]|nr:MAG: MBL fold metallo-hydrolase [Gemmatimonadales bacterium]